MGNAAVKQARTDARVERIEQRANETPEEKRERIRDAFETVGAATNSLESVVGMFTTRKP